MEYDAKIDGNFILLLEHWTEQLKLEYLKSIYAPIRMRSQVDFISYGIGRISLKKSCCVVLCSFSICAVNTFPWHCGFSSRKSMNERTCKMKINEK